MATALFVPIASTITSASVLSYLCKHDIMNTEAESVCIAKEE